MSDVLDGWAALTALTPTYDRAAYYRCPACGVSDLGMTIRADHRFDPVTGRFFDGGPECGLQVSTRQRIDFYRRAGGQEGLLSCYLALGEALGLTSL